MESSSSVRLFCSGHILLQPVVLCRGRTLLHHILLLWTTYGANPAWKQPILGVRRLSLLLTGPSVSTLSALSLPLQIPHRAREYSAFPFYLPPVAQTPNSLRENLVEDCSHAKLVNWVWRKRASAFHLDDRQRNECPMPLCRQLFNDFDDMIAHLQGCVEVARGWYWCWDCYRAEEFPLAQCRSCKCTWTQSSSTFSKTVKRVKRVLSNSLRRSLKGKRTRKENNALTPALASPLSELSAHPVPSLHTSTPPYDWYPTQESSPAHQTACADPWANFASIASVPSANTQSHFNNSLPELSASTSDYSNFFFSLPPPGRSTASSSLTTNVSLLSFGSPSQQRRGSLVSTATPRSSVSGSQVLSPFSPLSTTITGAASYPLTDRVVCESPTEMEDASETNQARGPWAHPKAPSWSSTMTYVSHGGSIPDTLPRFSELEGSPPDMNGPQLFNQSGRSASTPFPEEFTPQTISPWTTKSSHLLPFTHAPQRTHADKRKSPLLEALMGSITTKLNNTKQHLGVGPLMNRLQSKSVHDIVLTGIDELERQLAGLSGGAIDKLCFIFVCRAMAGECEKDLPKGFCTQMDADMGRHLWSHGHDILNTRNMDASRYFLDGKETMESCGNTSWTLTWIIRSTNASSCRPGPSHQSHMRRMCLISPDKGVARQPCNLLSRDRLPEHPQYARRCSLQRSRS